MNKKQNTSLKISFIDVLTILLAILTFTPFILPLDRTSPSLGGVPYTMWMGFLVSVLFVVLAGILSIIIKKDTHDDH